MASSKLELTTMNGDNGDREMVLGHLECVLDRDVVRARRVLGGHLPPPGPELDPGESPERLGAPPLVAVLPLAVLVLEERPGRLCRERVGNGLGRLTNE